MEFFSSAITVLQTLEFQQLEIKPGSSFARVLRRDSMAGLFSHSLRYTSTMECVSGRGKNQTDPCIPADSTDPVMIAVFPYPEVPENFPYKNFSYCGMDYPGPMGPHNLHEPMSHKPWIENRKDRVYDCYFHAGLRVYDVSDPCVPKEIAYFIPPNPTKPLWELEIANKLLDTEVDLVVDDRGYIYLNTMHDGVYILRCLV
jgi:hypothetical protein